MTLVIRAPQHREAEFRWVCDVVFGRWLGLAARIEWHERTVVQICLHEGYVEWADAFLGRADAHWLEPQTLQADPAVTWSLPDDELRRRIGQTAVPLWFGDGRFERRSGHVRLPIDITGSVFFMLSRYEEASAGAARDRHGRFPSSASLAGRAGLALRPVVDEWVELLWWALQLMAPGLQRAPRRARTWVSCDVDAPFSAAAYGLLPALRQSASDLVNRRSTQAAVATVREALAMRLGRSRPDRFDTFDWMCDVNERCGHRVTFFFLALRRPARIDCRYELTEPRVAALLQRLVRRGHEIALHASYGSPGDPDALAAEMSELRAAAGRAGAQQTAFGNRQHYLRWRHDGSARALQQAGVAYDSTLGSPDAAGFRCGTSHAFPLFDLQRREALSLIERPLVLMEAAVCTPTYLNLGYGERAQALMLRVREACARFGGEFAFLWHNSNFVEPGARELYEALIQPT